MNQVFQFLSRALDQTTQRGLMGGAKLSKGGKSENVLDDVTTRSRILLPGYFNIERQATVTLTSRSAEILGLKEGDIVGYLGQDWRVAQLEFGKVAWTVMLVNPNAKSANV